MFLWAPSGLVIYWFVSNLWAIGQQYFTNWLIGPPQGGVGSGRQAMNDGSDRGLRPAASSTRWTSI